MTMSSSSKTGSITGDSRRDDEIKMENKMTISTYVWNVPPTSSIKPPILNTEELVFDDLLEFVRRRPNSQRELYRSGRPINPTNHASVGRRYLVDNGYTNVLIGLVAMKYQENHVCHFAVSIARRQDLEVNT